MWKTMCGIAYVGSPPSPTGFQKPGEGVGQSEEGPSRWGEMGCGRESRPAEDRSDASFITRRHARSRKDGGRRAQAQGSKGEAEWGGAGKAGGGPGRPAVSGRK